MTPRAFVAVCVCSAAFLGGHARAAAQPPVGYKLLATSKTSTMEKEMNAAADGGFRFAGVMGGGTAIGGKEVVAIMARAGEAVNGRFQYKLLATSKTSTMQKELQQAGDAGFEYKDQTVFGSAFGGDEVVAILERDREATPMLYEVPAPGDEEDEHHGERAGRRWAVGLPFRRVDGVQDHGRRQRGGGDHSAREALAVRLLLLLLVVASMPTLFAQPDDAWLQWPEKTALEVGRRMRVTGRVGGRWGIRGMHTERAMNYELRATWMTPEVLRASARMAQLRGRRSAAEATRLLHEVEAAADTIVMVELDPREGSGVIPLDWAAYLQPKGAAPDSGRAVVGTLLKNARDYPAFAGVEKRDYDFDVFLLGFPLRDAEGRFVLADTTQAELVIRLNSSEGRVSWTVPESIRRMQRE